MGYPLIAGWLGFSHGKSRSNDWMMTGGTHMTKGNLHIDCGDFGFLAALGQTADTP